MTFGESVQICLKKYGDFYGRATRSEYWWFQLFYAFAVLLGHVLDAYYFGLEINMERDVEIFEMIAFFGLFIPAIAVGSRRLHDYNKSGWLQLLYLTIIGTIPVLYWLVQPSNNSKNNKY